jgi:signal transduction histidine kinase
VSPDTGTPPGRKTKRRRRAPRAAGLPFRFSISNWPVSVRLVALVAVACVTGLVFGSLRVADAVGTANGYARTTQLAVLGQQITLLEQHLENERDLTVAAAALTALQQDAAADKAGPAVSAPLRQAVAAAERQLTAAQGTTSAAATPVEQLAQRVIANSAFPESVRDGANSVLAQVSDGGLDAIRLEVIGQPPASIIADYAATLSDLFALNAQLAGSSGDAVLANEVNALSALSQAQDQAAQQRAILDAAFLQSGLNDAGGGKPTSVDPKGTPANNIGPAAALTYAGGLQGLVTAQQLQVTDLATFTAAATPVESEAYLAGQAGPQVEAAGNIYSTVISDNGVLQAIFPQLKEVIPGLTAATAPTLWYADQSAVVDAMQRTGNLITAQIVARSQLLQHQAFQSALLTGLATALVILLVLGATALIGHSLISPLRRLQSDALEIATVTLPARVAAAAAGTEAGEETEGTVVVEPVGVRSTDEIGRVARAFDQVHAEAVRLAGNEAQLRGSLNAMFISLSRRSVPLIDRLARMIDSMEQNEDDPNRLGNLFAIDHLVTRMRRNSENLLVLAGEEPVRKWTDSVPLADVTRAAAAEIEQYSRVALSVQPGVTVSGQAAADVVHLLAELIENATLFSPQQTQVRVTVMELTTGGVLVEIRDDGVGVSATRLDDMNWRLENPPALDVSVSRHMGLYAVSHLAARHGIRVKLRPGTPKGLSALVWLPGTLARHERVPAGSHSRPADAVGAGPAAAFRPAALAGPGPGRHRNSLVSGSGGQPLLGGRGGQQARPAQQPAQPAAQSAAVWFAAKRPSNGPARSAEELAPGWSSGTGGWAAAAPGPAGQLSGYNGGQPLSGPADGAADPRGQGEQTASGLPRRVPRTQVHPGSDTPGSGLAAAAPGRRLPVLGAPTLGMSPPPATPYQGAGYQAAAYQGAGYQEIAQPQAAYSGDAYPGDRYRQPAHEVPQQEISRRGAPPRQRSPEAARSRLSGFQLGSRDAVQAGPGPRQAPHAGEENPR